MELYLEEVIEASSLLSSLNAGKEQKYRQLSDGPAGKPTGKEQKHRQLSDGPAGKEQKHRQLSDGPAGKEQKHRQLSDRPGPWPLPGAHPVCLRTPECALTAMPFGVVAEDGVVSSSQLPPRSSVPRRGIC